jgi:hypothetical protein
MERAAVFIPGVSAISSKLGAVERGGRVWPARTA